MPVAAPDSWEVISGRVPDDIDQLTLSGITGAFALHFKNTTPASNPEVHSGKFIPVDPSEPYRITARVRADRAAGGDNVTVQMRYYDDTKSVIVGPGTPLIALNGVSLPVTVFSVYSIIGDSPSTAAYAKVEIVKANVNFDAYIDYVKFDRMKHGFSAYNTFTQSPTVSTWVKLLFPTAEYDFGGVYDDLTEGGTYHVTAKRASTWTFSAGCRADAFATAGRSLGVAINVNTGAGWPATPKHIVQFRDAILPSGSNELVSGSVQVNLGPGDQARAEVFHDQTAGALQANQENIWFTGQEE